MTQSHALRLERAKKKQAEEEEKKRREAAQKKVEAEERKREEERQKQEIERQRRREEEEKRREEEAERLKREEEERERKEAEAVRKAAAANIQCGDHDMAEARKKLETQVRCIFCFVACRLFECTDGPYFNYTGRTLMAPEQHGRRQQIPM